LGTQKQGKRVKTVLGSDLSNNLRGDTRHSEER
jgi:hypothetical protein